MKAATVGWPPRWLGALLACALASAHVPCSADASRIVVAGSPSVLPSLEAELRAIGLSPVLVTDGLPDRQELYRLAREHDAGAAIRVEVSAEGAEVWVLDRITGKIVLREVLVPPEDDDSDALVALRSVELLRASLLEVHAPHPTRGEVEPDEAVREAVEPPSARPGPVALDVGFATTGSPEGPDPAWHVRVAASFRVHRWVALAVSLWVPTWPATLSDAEGAADLWFGLATLALRLPFLDADALVQPHVGIAATFVLLSARGRATSPYYGRVDDALLVAPSLEAGVRWLVTPLLRVRVDVTGGVSTERLTLRFDGRSVTQWGWPFLGASLGLEVAVP